MNIMQFSAGFAVYLLFLTALTGLVMGSFCNAWAWRTANHENIARGRSHCPKCGHVLSPLDLVPLFSWLALKGKCRYCGEPIPKRYPVTELVSMLLYLTIMLRYGFCIDMLRYLILASLLFTASLVDLDIMEIPDGMLILAAVDSLLRLIADVGSWKSMLIGFFGVSVPLLIVVLIMEHILQKEAMGGGDIKLIAVLGLHFGFAGTLLTLIFACFIGLGAAVCSAKGKETAFPFGPSIGAAAWLYLMIGGPIISWYMSLL